MSEVFEPIVIKGFGIYNPGTKLWSRGGADPRWGKSPKVWSGIGPLKLHLQQFIYSNYKQKEFEVRHQYKGCVVYNVLTGYPVEGFEIYNYLTHVCETRKTEKYYANYEIVFQ